VDREGRSQDEGGALQQQRIRGGQTGIDDDGHGWDWIAQEVQKLFPELGSIDKPLVKAIKQLDHRVRALEANLDIGGEGGS
jgi:hypothetical protein